MAAAAGGALWLGNPWWAAFAALVGVAALAEWWRLVTRLASGTVACGAWALAGLALIGGAVALLIALRTVGLRLPLGLVLVTAAIDIGAYAAGRTIGGPKIAPAISPNKTWAGLGGAVVGAAAVLMAATLLGNPGVPVRASELVWPLAVGALLAVVAQGGDFFESWMKRRAGVKDSGRSIPGHGGVLDRVDGLVPVTLVGGGLLMLTLRAA